MATVDDIYALSSRNWEGILVSCTKFGFSKVTIMSSKSLWTLASTKSDISFPFVDAYGGDFDPDDDLMDYMNGYKCEYKDNTEFKINRRPKDDDSEDGSDDEEESVDTDSSESDNSTLSSDSGLDVIPYPGYEHKKYTMGFYCRKNATIKFYK